MTSTFSHAADFMSVSDASKLSETGELLLIDIRRPTEWQQTGSPKHSSQISMHEEGFLEKLIAKTGGKKDAKIALICAAGSRSSLVADKLVELGFTNISNVQEGMMGSAKGPGWLAEDLPLKK